MLKPTEWNSRNQGFGIQNKTNPKAVLQGKITESSPLKFMGRRVVTRALVHVCTETRLLWEQEGCCSTALNKLPLSQSCCDPLRELLRLQVRHKRHWIWSRYSCCPRSPLRSTPQHLQNRGKNMPLFSQCSPFDNTFTEHSYIQSVCAFTSFCWMNPQGKTAGECKTQNPAISHHFSADFIRTYP